MSQKIRANRSAPPRSATPLSINEATIPWKTLGFAAAALAVTVLGARRKNSLAAPMALAMGGALAVQRLREKGAKASKRRRPLTVSITIDRQLRDVLAFWQQLPFADASVNRGLELFRPGNCRVIREAQASELAWEIGGKEAHRGRCHFEALPNREATILRATVSDVVSTSPLRGVVKNLLSEDASKRLRDEFKRIKQLIEVGETATTEGQPQGKCKGGHR